VNAPSFKRSSNLLLLEKHLAELPRQDIPGYIHWHISRAGLERDTFDPAASTKIPNP
jgi:hypothetical protein